MENQNRNLLIATVLSFVVITAWMLLFPPAEPEAVQPEEVAETLAPGATDGAATPPNAAEQTGTDAAPEATPDTTTTAQTLENSPRIPVETPKLSGSISLIGGRIDDLHLSDYRVSLDKGSDTVTLLRPSGSDEAYYTLYGWAPGGNLGNADVPGAMTQWELEEGDTLTPETPITLAWTNDAGMIFRRTISVDEDYLFTVRQSVENGSDIAQRLAPYGLIARHGEPSNLKGFFILHEGVIRQDDTELSEIDYKDARELDRDPREGAPAEATAITENGWVGFTDHYWETILVPESGQPYTAVVKYVEGADIYQTEVRLPTIEVAPGATAEVSTRLFAGAKEWDTIRDYQNDEGIYRFLDSIDWGMFFFLTKPIFAVLHWLHSFIGNMGWSIIALTFVIKMVLFPLAYRSYVSMAKMKELQPEMEKLREQAGDDRMKMQQGMMELYKKNKVNPASGCLPILLQIPIWFSLYKVIFVTLELRHEPWFGWIRDLSAPDPSSILNLFGLLPNAAPDPTSWFYFFSLGVLPILLGISMWLQQKLNPAPADATQATIMNWMPWVFMFMLGRFASGLVIYWIANNTLTFIQQYTIMRSHGAKPDIFGNIKSSFKKKPATEKK
ncbi:MULTISPECIES: membrane protein insertase YidC [Maritimibacter]|uniref:Membrane protein insertase YidC n=1 Tax=Maritimibacter alkaliphilus HTCC2654 TaxID=314271 RepID=A3VF89_9RHOB|nr:MULTISPECIES: membrane protein insertase YidC [Maritimibacter]EAQ13004.1 putative inner membrane protein translocase component YidC [Rhodobacterales bacterium HTCC2654] [Maritimibacter alkaliphilus HTCC2654]MBL6428297.1 membrane protein insertase YidC [Maritimibacter sp.]TYP79938.1 protein translocase subunit yidC [Maritimibacter alkaliphilus HTCC2654]